MAIYAIGDIQGCYDELQQLLDKINFDTSSDKLWFTGDLVNRGPKSLETLRFIFSIKNNIVSVLGNHDLHLLATAYTKNSPRKKDTFQEILDAPDREELLNWLRHCPLLHHDSTLDLTLIHAGLHPEWTLKQAKDLANEVETILQGPEHIAFYQHMYGNEPANWFSNLEGFERLRVITNTLTRLRYCKPDGEAVLDVKGEPGSQPEGTFPWYEVENRVTKNEHIIFGHWSTLVLQKNSSFKNVYPIDTGCLWGGHLTALQIDVNPFKSFQLKCKGAQTPMS